MSGLDCFTIDSLKNRISRSIAVLINNGSLWRQVIFQYFEAYQKIIRIYAYQLDEQDQKRFSDSNHGPFIYRDLTINLTTNH